jgi:hypothetical protein
MSTVLATPERSTSTPDMFPAALPPPPQTSRPQRVLACVLCQQRKVKCDRKFPCANCIKCHTQCVPATLATRRRRRKFPDRELLERLHKYEDLLRQNNIKFEVLSKDPSGEKGPLNAVRATIIRTTGTQKLRGQSGHLPRQPSSLTEYMRPSTRSPRS